MDKDYQVVLAMATTCNFCQQALPVGAPAQWVRHLGTGKSDMYHPGCFAKLSQPPQPPNVSKRVRTAMEIVRNLKQEFQPVASEPCINCKTLQDVSFGPDPYAADIYDDQTPVWECGNCREASLGDI
jgi:hypothetical protein